MTSTLNQRSGTTSRNGTIPPGRFDLDAPASGPVRSRWPELSLGMLVVAVFALAGAWFYSNASETDSVLALNSPVERGAVVTPEDISVVEVASESQLNLVPSNQIASVVGQIALTDLSSGTLVTADLFAERAAIATGRGIVGLALGPGEFPSLSMRPGDMVRVVETPRQGDDLGGDMVDTVLVEMAEIVDVTPIGVQNQLFISLSMTTDEADSVAAAGSQDRVRLIQIAGE